jgi:hypothetical protein
LKTGYLVGATPFNQQLAIAIGAVTSALVIGWTLLALNSAGTIYTRRPQFLPNVIVQNLERLPQMEQPGGEYADKDHQLYHVLHADSSDTKRIAPGKYLVDDQGRIQYYVDPAINGRLTERDDGTKVDKKFDAPKAHLMAIIIDGILRKTLPWGLVIVGVLIAVTLELAGVPSLPFAVGVYLPIQTSVPIFCGGMLRWLVERRARQSGATESDSSPGVLLSSGYIAGGTIAGVLSSLLAFAPVKFNEGINLGSQLPKVWQAANWPAVVAFSALAVFLLLVGLGKALNTPPANTPQ